MSDIQTCQYDHTPDHKPTMHGEKGYCKVCLKYDYVAEAVGVNINGPGSFLVVRPVRWTPSPASEIVNRKVLAGLLPVAPAPGNEQDMVQLIQAIGDDNTAKIIGIAQRKDLSGEEKMKEIVKEDVRFAGKDSNEWSTLLGVSDAAIRGYSFWKELQKRKKSLA